MKIRNWISLGLLVSTATLAIACGGKDKDKDKGDGDGDSGETEGNGGQGNYSNDYLAKEIEDLKKQIADLEEQIENAQQQEIPDLQDDLDAANDRLDDLETCANGGACTGIEDGLALTQYSDAYCEWVFGCCSDDEARATLGQAAKDEDGCKSMFAQLLIRAGSVPTAPNMTTFSSDTFGQLAARLQAGRIKLDADALEACIELQNRTCNDAEPAAPGECVEGEGTSPCDEVMIGLQKEGESCASLDECEDGLFCSGGYGNIDGVCVVEAKVDDACQEEADCNTTESHLYCDEATGTCQERAGEGDDCQFADPTFNALDPSMLTVPCLAGFWCSAETSTCLATCDRLDEGDVCTSSDQCGDDMFCDMAELPDQGYAGVCAEQLNPGAASDVAEACKSGVVFADITDSNYNAYNCYYYGTDCVNTCAGRGGDDCSFDDFNGGDCNSLSCNEAKEECRTKCDANYDCADGETCKDGVCYESVASNSSCVVTEQCPDNQYCDASTDKCANRVKTGDPDDTEDDCTSDEECSAGSACEPNGNSGLDCRPYDGLGTGEYCEDWHHCSSGRCDLTNSDSLKINTCKATSGLGEAGDDCDMEDAIEAAGDFGLDESNINLDPCGTGLFCKRSAPNSSSDYTGTCTKQLAPGAVCDQSLNGTTLQCAGNQACVSNPATSVLSCRVPYSEPDQDNKCIFGAATFGTSVAYGDFGPI